MTDIDELRRLAQAATPGPWIAKNVSGAGLEIHMSHPLYPDKEWPAFGTGSAFCKKGLVSYETWTQFPHEVRDAQQAKNASFIAAANPAVISDLLDRLEAAEKERDALRAKITEMEKQEPVAWRTFDGEGGYDYRSYEDNENYKLGWDARNPNHIGWVEPLYALPGAQPAQSVPDVDALAQLIREIDGKHQLGAGALAERIVEWLAAAPEAKP